MRCLALKPFPALLEGDNPRASQAAESFRLLRGNEVYVLLEAWRVTQKTTYFPSRENGIVLPCFLLWPAAETSQSKSQLVNPTQPARRCPSSWFAGESQLK